MKKLLVLLLALCVSLTTASMLTGCECRHEWELKDIEKATCVVAGVENYECKLCGEKKTEEIPVDEDAHVYGVEWKSDFAYHWQESICEHAGLLSEKQEHDFDGEICSICGADEQECAGEEFKQILSKYAEFAKTQVCYTEGTNYTVHTTDYYIDTGDLYGSGTSHFTEDAYYEAYYSGSHIWTLKTENGFVHHAYYPGTEYVIDENLSDEYIFGLGTSLLSLYCDMFGTATSIKKVDEGVFELTVAEIGQVKVTFTDDMLTQCEYIQNIYDDKYVKYVEEFAYGNAKVPRLPNSEMPEEEWNDCFDKNNYINSTIETTVTFKNLIKTQTELKSIDGEYEIYNQIWEYDERYGNYYPFPSSNRETKEDVNNEYIKGYIENLTKIFTYEIFNHVDESGYIFDNNQQITINLDNGKFICYEKVNISLPFMAGSISQIYITGYQNFNPVDGVISNENYHFTQQIFFKDLGGTVIMS